MLPRLLSCLVVGAFATALPLHSLALEADLSRYSVECAVKVRTTEPTEIQIEWPLSPSGGVSTTGRLTLDLEPDHPLIKSLALVTIFTLGEVKILPTHTATILRGVDPALYLTVGTRAGEAARPPGRSIWATFFDSPVKRPHETFRSRFTRGRVAVTGTGDRATVTLDGLSAGPFAGGWELSFYAGSPFIQLEAVLATTEDEHAFYYDLGLIGERTGITGVAWRKADSSPKVDDAPLERAGIGADGAPDLALAVRHRTIVAETPEGSLACFPPPHQFFFPRDSTDNLKYVWYGRNHAGGGPEFGFGVRQAPEGGGRFSPWYNAPPNTRQRMGMFLLPVTGKAEDAMRQTLRYTHGDHYEPLNGFVTFASHLHMAVADEAVKRHFEGEPEFVSVFRDLGVQAIHLADFHGDGHQRDPGPLRLPEQAALFKECARLSGKDFLLLPGEEVMEQFYLMPKRGLPGHWNTFFPKEVYWTQNRADGQPFDEQAAPYGTVYHVGSAGDMDELLRREHGLAWTTHPRIKASQWTPDAFRHEEFFHADTFLGAAWKAMPADLSRERLGERSLDLLDDMCNWGERKYLPGEVDVFKIDRTHELYGHMNVNYLMLDHLPRYEEGWQPVLDALRGGKFFTTTGEVLIPSFQVDGKSSGETVRTDPGGKPHEAVVSVRSTFPLRFLDVISGDGQQVYHERHDPGTAGEFSQMIHTYSVRLKGCKWVRVEAWDIAGNGAYTQPVWLEP